MDVTTMQGLHRSVTLALVLAWTASNSFAQLPRTLPEHYPDAAETSLSFQQQAAGRPAISRNSSVIQTVHVPDARYVKLHFDSFELPEGLTVEVSDPERSEVYRYSQTGRDTFTWDELSGDNGVDSFWAMSISGDTAVVRLIGKLSRFDPLHHSLAIDTWTAPPRLDLAPPTKKVIAPNKQPHTETVCGGNERREAACWKDSHPNEFERGQPTALVVAGNGEECTAWRVGPDNLMMTASHCIWDNPILRSSEIWFNYENSTCGGSDMKTVVKVTGHSVLVTDADLDYTLFTVNGFQEIKGFGNYGLDVRNGAEGEPIFIPQHGYGDPKQISIESDMNIGGECAIDAASVGGFVANSDIGYFCDTTKSSSGAPVVSGLTGRVIALHHLGGCFNQGAKISVIWPYISGFFDGKVPEGDSNGDWAPANNAPTADFTVDCDGLGCTLDGSGSSDLDGHIVDYYWTFGDGEDALGINVVHVYTDPGVYSIDLIVEDDEGATGNFEALIEVTPPNIEPEAKFSTVCIENKCTFDASSSVDSDGEIINWEWTLGDGSQDEGSEIAHVYEEADDFTVVLTVMDDDQATDKSSHTVSVTLPNRDPEARFTWSCEGLDCSFDASDSQDPDGQIARYNWDFGNGEFGEGQLAEFRYGDAGGYTVTLTVRDDGGIEHASAKSIEVTQAQPQAEPVANFSASCKGLTCTLDGSISTPGDYDINSYSWSFGDGNLGSGRTVNHTFNEAGNYYISLIVVDKNGSSDTLARRIEATETRIIELTVSPIPGVKSSVAVLNWHGAKSDSVRIVRNGGQIAEVKNRGKFLDRKLQGVEKMAAYQVCEMDTGLCSSEVYFRSRKR